MLRGRYVLEKRLGSGGKGTVFKALDRYRADLPEAQQYVAVKILHATADGREEQLAKLRREFYRAQMLSHRNVVNVFELDRDGDLDFFTMEYLDGELLSGVMERLHPLPMSRPQAWAIIREIGSGLAHAHSRDVIHTDLKPHNILITRSGEVRILDFGGSSGSTKPSPDDRPRPRRADFPVTPAYACCELLEGRPADPRDDIYAFACIAYELLAGTHPFQRRRSTEARDLGIVPKRPPELTRRQWQALTMGLSWHRAGRSMSVRSWLEKLDTKRVAVGQLPHGLDLKSAQPNPRPAPFRATALFAVLLITVGFWVSVARLAAIGKIVGGGPAPAVAASGHASADSAAPVGGAEPAANPAASIAMQAGPQEAAAPDAPPMAPQPQSPAASAARRNIHRSKPPAGTAHPVVVSASNYKVRSGEHFAEIRVHRSGRSGSDLPFVWWTEAASAKPGIDYVPQGKVMQTFPKGKRSTSFFIKLVPNASRARPEVFYIAIAEAHRASSAGKVARAAVWLPPNDAGSAAIAARNNTSARIAGSP